MWKVQVTHVLMNLLLTDCIITAIMSLDMKPYVQIILIIFDIMVNPMIVEFIDN